MGIRMLLFECGGVGEVRSLGFRGEGIGGAARISLGLNL